MKVFAGHKVVTLQELKEGGAKEILLKEGPPSMCEKHDAYSTLSERSAASLDVHETESICSNRSRISLLPSSRVEQSRVDAKSVVEKLFQNHDLLHTDEEEGSGGLKIYVDKNKGTVTVAGPDLDR